MHVVGKTLWSHAIDSCDLNKPVALCLASDEAFTYLLLENSWQRWTEIFDRKKDKVFAKRFTKKKIWESDTPAKYCTGGIIFNKKENKRPERGWNTAGMHRYNKLFQFVKKNRKQYPERDMEVVKKLKATRKNRHQKKRGDDASDNIILLYMICLKVKIQMWKNPKMGRTGR